MDKQIDILSLTPEKLAELQAEERARIKEAEDRKAAEEAAAAAKRTKAAVERAKKFMAPAEAIIAELEKLAPQRKFEARIAEFGGAVIQVLKEGKRNYFFPKIELTAQRDRLSYSRYAESSLVRITVGEYGDRTQFPPRKDGKHSYVKIATEAMNRALAREKREATENEMAKVRQNNGREVFRFCKEQRVRKYDSVFSVEASSNLQAPLFIRVGLQRAMTVENAKALHAALVSLGLVTQAESSEEQ